MIQRASWSDVVVGGERADPWRLSPGIVVLDSGWKSARGGVGFSKTRKAFELLRTLASVYWEDLAHGKGDREARPRFGNSYAPRESETVMNNKKARELRTFEYVGKPVEMWRHLKIGVKPSVAETMRVHFLWDDKAMAHYDYRRAA